MNKKEIKNLSLHIGLTLLVLITLSAAVNNYIRFNKPTILKKNALKSNVIFTSLSNTDRTTRDSAEGKTNVNYIEFTINDPEKLCFIEKTNEYETVEKESLNLWQVGERGIIRVYTESKVKNKLNTEFEVVSIQEDKKINVGDDTISLGTITEFKIIDGIEKGAGFTPEITNIIDGDTVYLTKKKIPNTIKTPDNKNVNRNQTYKCFNTFLVNSDHLETTVHNDHNKFIGNLLNIASMVIILVPLMYLIYKIIYIVV